MKYAFITVTDYSFFPGTVATVNSVLHFHPDTLIYVIQNEKHPLSAPQAELLKKNPQIRLLNSSAFMTNGRYINAWELKAYGANDLCGDYDVIVGIDSDCLLCSPVDDIIREAHHGGAFVGGKDGNGAHYGEDYRVYGIKPNVQNPSYMSTSLFFCAVTPQNRQILSRWAECCSSAVFNGQGAFPGHGDQGVLNAVLFATNRSQHVQLLPNPLWSQHWVFWDTITDLEDGIFINRSVDNQRQRSFHCGGAEKFWVSEHRDRILGKHPLQTYPYMWFLAMFWFGACRNWKIDPCQYLPPISHHLTADLCHFLSQVLTVLPAARSLWDGITDQVLDRALDGVPRFLSLGGGSMNELVDLVHQNTQIRRFVEIGGYEGGSILLLALRFANRDIDFFSVESFMGNFDGKMDGGRLPSREQFLKNLARFPHARVKLIPCDSKYAAAQFNSKTIDCLFIDGCHDTAAVLKDIDVWRPKVRAGGIICGDDYGWDTVRQAVLMRFPDVKVTRSGCVWWTQV